MPKNTMKRTKVKDLPRSKQDLNAKAAKKVKGGVENLTTLSATVQKIKIGGTGTKGSFDLGQLPGGLQ
jgi:hypothetical protein